jgi:amidohydrolase
MRDRRLVLEEVRGMVAEMYEELVELRRDLHAHPELAFEEVRTSRKVASWLMRLGLAVQTGVAQTGVIATLSGARPGPTVALRADMDALPLQDEKDVPYRSRVNGRMHACGHDAHTAMLLGAAAVLVRLRERLAGNVRFLFQPAEEGPGGALPMIEAGALEGVDVIFAQHVTPSLEAGTVAVADGPAMAAVDDFRLVLHGQGGHAGYPHRAVDAIQIAGQVIVGLQPLISRYVDPLSPAVVTIGRIEGGSAENLIAERVTLRGTIRTFDRLLRDEIPQRIEQIVSGITAAYGGHYEWTLFPGYPALINHAREVGRIRQVAGEVLGPARVFEAPPSMGGEDFSYYLERVPGCLWWLGAMPKQVSGADLSLHHPRFDINEQALAYGVEMLVMSALAYMLPGETDGEPS